jgi:alpha-1,3-rhamnosyl/mannosyltransferase
MREAGSYVGERFGLAPGYLLSVGTIEPRKGHLLLLRALDVVRDAPLLVVVGQPGWNCSSLLARMASYEAQGRVRYLGSVDDGDLPYLYAAAKLMVLPSLYEGFGSPVLEAMACGCPVLCSWTSSLPEVGGKAARYFRAGDAADLASQLACLLREEPSLVAMREAGLCQAVCFSYERTARQVLAALGRSGQEGGRI